MGKTTKTAMCTREVNQLGYSARKATKPLTEFSKLQNGKHRTICKKCQTELANEWTREMADYRKVYQRAHNLVLKGLDIQVPTAKTFKKGMKLRYTNGRIYNPKTATV